MNACVCLRIVDDLRAREYSRAVGNEVVVPVKDILKAMRTPDKIFVELSCPYNYWKQLREYFAMLTRFPKEIVFSTAFTITDFDNTNPPMWIHMKHYAVKKGDGNFSFTELYLKCIIAMHKSISLIR